MRKRNLFTDAAVRFAGTRTQGRLNRSRVCQVVGAGDVIDHAAQRIGVIRRIEMAEYIGGAEVP
jgi:hypothetical protein